MASRLNIAVLLLPCLTTVFVGGAKECVEPERSKWYDTCETPKVKSRFCHEETCLQRRSTDTCGIVVQSLLADYSVFDVVMVQSGLCQAEIPAGDFTKEVAEAALPINEELIGLQINGSDLLATVEHGLHLRHKLQLEEGFPRVSGMRFRVNPRRGFMRRISNPEILTQECQWSSVDPATAYNVLVSKSIADGAYRYETLRTAGQRIETGLRLRDAFYTHAQSVCVVRDPFQSPEKARKKVVRMQPSAAQALGFQNRTSTSR